MATVRDYRELRVYQIGFQAAMGVYRATRRWPSEERFSLSNQAIRSSRAVCGCLAEGWQRRRYPASFAAKLIDARGEAQETTVWLDFALACDYLAPDEHAELIRPFHEITRMLTRMGASPGRWAGPSPPPPS